MIPTAAVSCGHSSLRIVRGQPGAPRIETLNGPAAFRPSWTLIDVASALGITERSAYGIVNDLAKGGYVVKEKDGRRNRYQVQGHLPRPGSVVRSTTVGEGLAVDSHPCSRDAPVPVFGSDGAAITALGELVHARARQAA
jgi:hypothetical protein